MDTRILGQDRLEVAAIAVAAWEYRSSTANATKAESLATLDEIALHERDHRLWIAAAGGQRTATQLWRGACVSELRRCA